MAFRRVFGILSALALVAAIATPSYAQEKKPSKEDIAHAEALRLLLDGVLSGKQPAPSDVKLTFHNHFVGAADGSVYIPFTLDLQPAFSTFPVALYVRAVAKGAAAPVPAAPGAKPAPAAAPRYAFEDGTFYTAASNKVERALALAPGDYDLHVVMGERAPKDKKAPAPKSTVLTVPLTVPNLGSGLATSTIILARALEPAGAALTAQQQKEQPYTLSGFKITPTYDGSFAKSTELVWLFYVYNAGVAPTGKADLQVEYNFFRANEEKPFTRFPTSAHNATSGLRADWAAGDEVLIGNGVALETFAPGAYRVEMKITDKTNSESLTKTTAFSVTP